MPQAVIHRAKTDPDVLAVALFGSSLKRKGRDIDVCLILNKKLSNLKMSKKRKMYLSRSTPSVDLQIFQQLPLYIRMRILKEGEILLSKNEEHLYKIAIETIKQFGLYKRVYESYLNKVKHG